MARRPIIRREQIVEAARGLFMEQGFKASTAAIARAAGISEGSIFKKFPSKHALFREAMGVPDFERDLTGYVGHGYPRQQLQRVAEDLLAFFRELVPRLMHVWAHGIRSPMMVCFDEDPPPPVRVIHKVSEYLKAETKLGRLQVTEPEVTARMLIASMHNFVFLEVMGIQAQLESEASEYIAEVVNVLWNGVAPESTVGDDDRSSPP